jgi:hypothetical protein
VTQHKWSCVNNSDTCPIATDEYSCTVNSAHIDGTPDTTPKIDLSQHNTVLKLSYVNVCGLMSKLHNPDFIQFVQQNDIVHFSETKLDCFDNPIIDGYTFIGKNREHCTNKSEGVGILLKIVLRIRLLL